MDEGKSVSPAGVISSNLLYRYGDGSASTFLFPFFSQVLTLDARAGAGGGRLLPDASQLTPGIARKHGQTQENTYRTPPVLWKKENGKVARGLSIFFSHFSFMFFSRFLF